MPLPAVAPSDSQIDQLARAIVARDRYRAFHPDSYDLGRHLREALDALLSFIAELYAQSPALYWLLVLGLGLFCALLLTHMVWSLHGALRASPEAAHAPDAAVERDFAAEAQQLAARGEYLEAAHQLLLSALRLLAKARHIPLRPEDGNAAVCRLLAKSSLPAPLRAQLVELILQTEHAWFGDAHAAQRVAADLYARWRTTYRQLERTAAV